MHTYSRVENSDYKNKHWQQFRHGKNRKENDQRRTNSQIENPVSTSPIKGKAIFNKTVVEYLYDGGADRTIISSETYKQIKTEDIQTLPLEQYKNKSLESANGPLDVAGVLKLNTCILSDRKAQIDEPKVIVKA
jgi:hypothetical protein